MEPPSSEAAKVLGVDGAAVIFVDSLIPCIPNCKWRWNQVSHLMVNNGQMDELHAFARQLGLKRAWFQDTDRPHYDLTPGMRKRAVAYGAREFSREETVAVLRGYRTGAIKKR